MNVSGILFKSTATQFCIIALSFLVLMNASTSCGKPGQKVEDLKVTFISNISHDPVFSWKINAEPDGFAQQACQVIISNDRDIIDVSGENIWDSQKLETSNSIQIRYDGPALENGKEYFARVRVWDQNDVPSAWSEGVRFIVPMEYPGDWQAEWLTYDYEPDEAMPLFRKAFEIPDTAEINDARFYIAGPGYYEASLNGKKIGENVLDPGQTNYEDYAYYTAYDIDPGDLAGENVLGVMLGNGWYNQDQVWKGQAEYARMVYGQPVFLCQLVIQKKNGSRQVISSDDSWMWTPGPITYSNVYGGEHYDARLEIKNWNSPGEVSGDWQPVLRPEVHPTKLYEQFAEPIRVMDQIQVKKIIFGFIIIV